jgi:hypothetical protein
MSAEDNTKITVQRCWDEVVTRVNLSVADGLFAPGWALYRDREAGFCDLKEPSGPAVRADRDYTKTVISGLKVTVENQMDAGADRVVTRFTVSGTRNHSVSGVCGDGFSS